MSKPMVKDLRQRRFFVSWSGGKESCLALYRAVRSGGLPSCLFTMMDENGEYSRGHGLPREVLCAQAMSLGIPIIFRSASWEGYEAAFLDGLREIQGAGTSTGVFGDIDMAHHRHWVHQVCSTMHLVAVEPLWGETRQSLLKELIASGFKATVVAAKDGLVSPEYLGRTMDMRLIGELGTLAIDLCGEAGEYHTVVTDGPLFREPVAISLGARTLREGYWFLRVGVAGAS